MRTFRNILGELVDVLRREPFDVHARVHQDYLVNEAAEAMLAESLPRSWYDVAGLRLACSWSNHVGQPYAEALLRALTLEFANVSWVIAFDGHIDESLAFPAETLSTLSLFCRARGSATPTDVLTAADRSYRFILAFIAGWRAGSAA